MPGGIADGVRAILHVHAWMDGVRSTELTYPCGTYEIGRAVADLVRTAPDTTTRSVASRAMPAPVIPPPITTRS